MSRAANYAIKGFLYQFLTTLGHILDSGDNDQITIEGIEDLDILLPTETQLVQFKYHEEKTFTISSLYKPILHMMCHYMEFSSLDIKYTLYVHFNDGQKKTINRVDIQGILNSKSKEYVTYIQKCRNIDIDSFLEKFCYIHGDSFDEMENSVTEKLKGCMSNDPNVDILFYPNAIHKIASISSKKSKDDRITNRKHFLSELGDVKKLALSRWTMELKSREKFIKAKKIELQATLKIPSRLRYFLFDGSLEDFEDEIVKFIKDYVNKYHSRPAQTKTPCFYLDCDLEQFSGILIRLHHSEIKVCHGYIGVSPAEFDEATFFREPIITLLNKQISKREFHIRICCYQVNPSVIRVKSCEDLFIVGNKSYNEVSIKDIEVENLNVSISELKGIFKL